MIESQGKIKNIKRLRQIPVFENLRFESSDGSLNSIQSPTDIDACFEFQGKIIIHTDYKLEGKQLETGQYKSLTSQINAMQKGGYLGAYILIAEHNTDENQELYDGSNCRVVKVYYKKEWITPPRFITVKEMYLHIFKMHNIPLQEFIPKSALQVYKELFG